MCKKVVGELPRFHLFSLLSGLIVGSLRWNWCNYSDVATFGMKRTCVLTSWSLWAPKCEFISSRLGPPELGVSCLIETKALPGGITRVLSGPGRAANCSHSCPEEVCWIQLALCLFDSGLYSVTCFILSVTVGSPLLWSACFAPRKAFALKSVGICYRAVDVPTLF